MFLTVLKIQLDEGLFLILMKEPDFTSAEGRKFAKKTTFIMEISLKLNLKKFAYRWLSSSYLEEISEGISFVPKLKTFTLTAPILNQH